MYASGDVENIKIVCAMHRRLYTGILIKQIKDTLRPPLTPVAVAVDLSAHALVTPSPQTLLAITVKAENGQITDR